jgi:hypothetical protein
MSRFFYLLVFGTAIIGTSVQTRADDLELVYPDNNVSSKDIIEFRAREPRLFDRLDHSIDPGFGHTFVFLGKELDNGLTFFYSAAGFYPENHTLINTLYGPGKVKYELPDMHDDIVFRTEITSEQADLVSYIISNWDTKKYSIVWQNCVSLDRDIGRALGLKVPEFDPLKIGDEVPSKFIQELRDQNPEKASIKHASEENARQDAVLHDQMLEQAGVLGVLKARQQASDDRLRRGAQGNPFPSIGGGGVPSGSGGGNNSGSGASGAGGGSDGNTDGTTFHFNYKPGQ